MPKECVNFGDGKSKCPATSPCCFGGYCDSSAYFCILGNCDPSNSYSPNSCWPKPMCKNINQNFNDASVLVPASGFTGEVDKQIFYSSELVDHARISNGNLALGLRPDSDLKKTGLGSTVYYSRWVDHGTITITAMSGCKSPGVVSSFIVRNEFGDEIDFEWVGLDTSTVQTNYYYNDELDYTKMVPSNDLGDTTSKFIDYTIDWKLDSISWYAAGSLIRTVNRQDTWSVAENVFKFPDRPAQLSFSIWDGCNERPKGTSDWAGCSNLYSSASSEYVFNIKNVKVNCLYSGNDTYVIPNNATPSSTAKPSFVSIPPRTSSSSSSSPSLSSSRSSSINSAFIVSPSAKATSTSSSTSATSSSSATASSPTASNAPQSQSQSSQSQSSSSSNNSVPAFVYAVSVSLAVYLSLHF
ncbi:putative glycosidase crf2 [Smittium culicis]|uniref:Putative glycosidase crf2 n=1 Tax=Smittium culicis TaxID=133412 RepID=A0A1R1XHA5_9FUNG|nr:putative glycosidase crf2 [Smittium culicis]